MVSGDRLDCRLGRFFRSNDGCRHILRGRHRRLARHEAFGFFDYDFELQQFLRETKISYDRLSSIALRSFTYGALALVSVTVIGFGGY